MRPRPWQAQGRRYTASRMNELRDGLISRSDEVPNFEMPFGTLRDFVTPNESFYVRCHFPIPEIRTENWRLSVEGAVASPRKLTYAELESLPFETLLRELRERDGGWANDRRDWAGADGARCGGQRRYGRDGKRDGERREARQHAATENFYGMS